MRIHQGYSTFVFLFVLLLSGTSGAQAQERYAAFIHGFTFGDDRPSAGVSVHEVLDEKGARWEASGTIDRWTGTAIDGSVLLKYFDRDLYGGARDKTFDRSRTAMMERFVTKMKETAPNAEWVLVGHSQGGIVARLLHEHIRTDAPNLDVKGVLSIASPMQGGTPTTVSYGARSGYINVKPVVDGFLKDVLKGPLGDATSGLLKFAVPGVGIVFDIVANFWDPTEYAAEGVIELNQDKLRGLNEMAVEKKAKDAIGPDGNLIRKINRAKNPRNYRALLGSERTPVAARVASGRETEKEKLVTFGFWGTLGAGVVAGTSIPNFVTMVNIFQGNKEVAPGEEPVTVNFFHKVKDSYEFGADFYRFRCYGTLGIGCLAGDYRKWKRWKQGRRAIQNFGSTFTEILNAYRLDQRVRSVLDCSDPGSKRSTGDAGEFAPPTAEEYIHGYLDDPDTPDGGDGPGENCHYVEETYYVTVPNKTDGLLGTKTTTWNPPEKGQEPNLGSNSILYNEQPSRQQSKRGGTGYNHAEMVYSRRRYNSSDDPGIGGNDPSFEKGDPNPPMQEGQRFLERQVFK